MNAIFPAIKEYMLGASGLNFLNGKFKFYAVNLAAAGPASTSWKIDAVSDFTTEIDGTISVQVDTTVAHGILTGNMVAVRGFLGTVPTWVASTAYKIGSYAKPTTPNGKRYKCVVPGTTGGSQPTWPTLDGEYVFNGTVAFMCDGADTISPLNGIWPCISGVAAATDFRLGGIPAPFPSTSGLDPATAGHVANLSKTYLSEFAPSGSRVASGALTGKSILAGGVLDSDFFTVNPGVTEKQALILAKAAALEADVDLADTAQRLVAYYDTMPGLPLPANVGATNYDPANAIDRLLRL